MLSQTAVSRALKGLTGAVTSRQFCLLIKKADVLQFLVICDAGFHIFHNSISFLLQRIEGGEQKGRAWIKKSFILPFFGQSGLVYFILTVGKDKIACLRTHVNIISRKDFVCSSLHD